MEGKAAAAAAAADARLLTEVDRARAAEHDARIKLAQAEAHGVVLEGRLKAIEAAEAAGGVEAAGARKAEAALSAQLLSAQGQLRERADELLAAQQEGRRHAAAASAAAQEKELVQQALSRLQAEVAQQVQAKSELCALLEKVQQMQSARHERLDLGPACRLYGAADTPTRSPRRGLHPPSRGRTAPSPT